MTPQPLIQQPNAAFWQVLEKYIQGRIVEQVAEGLEIRPITDTLTPATHQRMIDRLTAELNPATPVLNKETLRRIEWHIEQHLLKTGQLPK